VTGKTGKKRWMPLALGISLAINLAVVAVVAAVAGAAWRHKGEDRSAMRSPRGAPAFIQALPREAWLAQVTAMDAQERSAYAERLGALAERRKSRLKKNHAKN